MDQTIMGLANHSDFTVYYDANGTLYRIVEKKKWQEVHPTPIIQSLNLLFDKQYRKSRLYYHA
jgi:cytochrome oxidase Cu insertion factor (SCO1/SenC/PrrC family)